MSVHAPAPAVAPAPVRIGCSGWIYKHWRALFYPEALPVKRWFAYYAGEFAHSRCADLEGDGAAGAAMSGLVPAARSGDSQRMARRLPLMLIPLLLLGGCLSAMAANENTSRVRLNQVASLGLVRVTPLQVIEDSRCPQDVQCVWAGQLRLRASVATPSGEHERALTLGQPQSIGGGTLVLQDVTPRPTAEAPIAPRDYSFVLHYTVPSVR